MNNYNRKKAEQVFVKKSTGEIELFDTGKLERSLQNSSVEDALIDEIVSDISAWIYEGVSTHKIYSRAYRLLRKLKSDNSPLYRLKKAMLELGPTGYPFEILMSEIFSARGYSVKTGQIIEGFCLSHEMDVIATKQKSQILFECKYASDQGKRVGVQVPLYVHSRVNDIVRRRKDEDNYLNFTFSAGVITNTRFSSDSIEYARCYGIHLLGWDFPEGNGLKRLMEKEKILPVTIVNTLTKNEKKLLLENRYVTCSQLFHNLKDISFLSLNTNKLFRLRKELENLSNQ